jgi:predicted dehydrogenase
VTGTAHTSVGWGILGTGIIATAFADAVSDLPDGRVVAVASRRNTTAEAFADRFDIPGRYVRDDDLFADPRVDAVYVATPHHLHHDQTVAALRAGKPVLCEKPFAINATEAASMIRTARETGVFCMEAMWTRFLPFFERLREVVASGRIGEVRQVRADFGFPVRFDPASRLFDPALGGGSLLDLGVYPITIAWGVLGPPDDFEAWAHLGETGVDEQFGALLTYRSGAMASVSSSLRAFGANEAIVAGDHGYVRIPQPFHHASRLEVHDAPDGDFEVIETPYEGNGYGYEAAAVHRALHDGATEDPRMPLDTSLAVMRLLDALRERVGLRYPADG